MVRIYRLPRIPSIRTKKDLREAVARSINFFIDEIELVWVAGIGGERMTIPIHRAGSRRPRFAEVVRSKDCAGIWVRNDVRGLHVDGSIARRGERATFAVARVRRGPGYPTIRARVKDTEKSRAWRIVLDPLKLTFEMAPAARTCCHVLPLSEVW